MTHLAYVATCFGLGLAVPAVFAVTAWRRLGRARRRLAAIDPRGAA